ncbi:uncharacterized protein LOC111017113 [Momordica charantia]|uniref:Uncharacterized protein LOC111017113 n=1 Tax=Momordica charantia TaxID=3673 RepID=A0A6J1D484_MOMCH|nr:uncharacterized protein LOC111017113 [Momordica charantia]
MATTISTSLSLPIFLSTFNPKPHQFLRLRSSSTPNILSRRPALLVLNPLRQNSARGNSIRRLHATSEQTLASESAALVEKSQEITSSGDDGVSTIISALLFVAFIGLSILTIGVIYIAVTDFLQKREKEKFEKVETAKNKKSGKKKKVRARAGPRGFGQKIEEEEQG